MEDRNTRLPVPLKARTPEPRPALVPALWQQAAPAVARGAALVAAGLIGEWLLRAATRRALNPPGNRRRQARKSTALVPRPADDLPAGTVAVTETVIMTRRVIFRR